jgi:hypothetical protein
MRFGRWIGLLVILAFVGMSACTVTEADAPSGDASPTGETPMDTPAEESPDPVETEESPLPPPDMDESPLPLPKAESPLPTPLPDTIEAPDVADELRTKVAAEIDVSPDALTALSMERVTWRDASLGCPEPGKMYAQVLTEGWRAVYQDAQGRRIEVHATQSLETFVICEGKANDPARPPLTSEDHPAAQAAINALAEKLDVAADVITVRNVEPEEWPTSCLGCGKPNESCLTVITPGYRVMLEYDGEVYEMRTDRVGRSVRLCERGGA